MNDESNFKKIIQRPPSRNLSRNRLTSANVKKSGDKLLF